MANLACFGGHQSNGPIFYFRNLSLFAPIKSFFRLVRNSGKKSTADQTGLARVSLLLRGTSRESHPGSRLFGTRYADVCQPYDRHHSRFRQRNRRAHRPHRPKLFRISRLRCVDTESKTVPYVSVRDVTTHGRMVAKTGITARLRSHFLPRVVKNRIRSSEATLPPRRDPWTDVTTARSPGVTSS